MIFNTIYTYSNAETHSFLMKLKSFIFINILFKNKKIFRLNYLQYFFFLTFKHKIIFVTKDGPGTW